MRPKRLRSGNIFLRSFALSLHSIQLNHRFNYFFIRIIISCVHSHAVFTFIAMESILFEFTKKNVLVVNGPHSEFSLFLPQVLSTDAL